MTFVDILDGGPAPKRGDLVQSNVGDARERTWLILQVRKVARRGSTRIPRFAVWMERWWEIEPFMRMALFKSAERAGGQRVIFFKRYPARKRKTFEEYMARELCK